jgi:hypothetical protein
LWDNGGTAETSDDRNYVRDLGSLSKDGIFGGSLTNWASTAATPVLEGNKLMPKVGGIFSLGTDANLTSFLSGTSNVAGLRWNITAADSNGTDRFLTTSSGITAAQLPTYTEFRTFATVTGSFLTNTTAIGSNESIILTGVGAGLVSYGNNVAGKAKFTTDGAVGDSLGFYLLSEKATTGTVTKATLNQFSDSSGNALTWQFQNDGTLIYAAVPEPESYALFLAGLGMIGAIARRRRLGK